MDDHAIGSTAEDTARSAQGRVIRMSERAQDLARRAKDRVAQATGQRVEPLVRPTRSFVRDHPLQALAVGVGLGYVLGKLIRRR